MGHLSFSFTHFGNGTWAHLKNHIFVSGLKPHCRHGDAVNNRFGLGLWAFGAFCAPPAPTCVMSRAWHTHRHWVKAEKGLLWVSHHHPIFLQFKPASKPKNTGAHSADKDMPKTLIRNYKPTLSSKRGKQFCRESNDSKPTIITLSWVKSIHFLRREGAQMHNAHSW